MKRTAVFLDRDGVLNVGGRRPPNSPEELIMLPGVGRAVSYLNKGGFWVFVVTNQGGVGLGYMSQEDLNAVHKKMAGEIAKEGGKIDRFVACTHKPREGCSCRKPQPGMIFALAEEFNIDLKNSYFVGDRDVDMEAGKNASTKTVFIGSLPKAPSGVDFVASDLTEASKWIIEDFQTRSDNN